MKYITCLIVLFIWTVSPSYAQTRKQTLVKGTVKTTDGQPADNVSVMIKGTSIGSSTDDSGEFTIKNLKPGTYVLMISGLNAEREEKEFSIQAGQTVTVNFTLNETSQSLQVVNIASAKTNRFKRRSSDMVARMPLKDLENPQAYTTIGKELMQEQIVTNFDDALKNSPGLDKLWSSTGRGGDGAAYFTLRGFTIQPSLINGIAGISNGGLDPANIEKIEVIKGPSGTLFGGSLTNFGGLINIVTKRPTDSLSGEVSYTGGGFGLNRITADFNTPVNKSKSLLFRVNTAYHYEKSFLDAGFRRSLFIAPSLQYTINDRLSFNLNTEFYNGEGTNPLMVFLNRSRQLIARTPAELNMNFNRSYTSNDVTTKTPSTNVYGQMNYRISKQWLSQTNVSRSVRKSDGYYQYVMFITASDTLLNRYANIQNSTGYATNIQQNFVGDFKIGNMRNRLVAGLDYLNNQLVTNDSPYILYDQIGTQRNDPRYINFSRAGIDAKVAAGTTPPGRSNSETNIYSVYASDVLNITPQLLAMASLRIDRFQNKGTYNYTTTATSGNYLQTALSPKFGLVYQVVKDKISLFGNYMNGFRNVAPVVQPAQTGLAGVFKPQQANQIEGGVKMNVFGSRLNFTASYYDISVKNVTRPETITLGGIPYNVTVQDGTQKSKGFEFDFIANPVEGLNIVAGYSYNYSKLVKAAPSVAGRRPVSAGPEDLINAWASYNFMRGPLRGFGLGFGGNYASENLITNTTTTGIFTLPAYTVLNSTLFYSGKDFRIGVKVDNLTDKAYFKGWTTVEPQMPRRFTANLSFRF